jgi:hypothetical protein
MQLTASVDVLQQCTTTATLSPVHVPQICDHLQLILKEVSSGRTLYAPQAHTLATAAHCMHLRHTHSGHCSTLCTSGTHTQWSLPHTACTSGTHTGHCSTLYASQARARTHTHTMTTAAHCTTCYNAQQCIYVPRYYFQNKQY